LTLVQGALVRAEMGHEELTARANLLAGNASLSLVLVWCVWRWRPGDLERFVRGALIIAGLAVAVACLTEYASHFLGSVPTNADWRMPRDATGLYRDAVRVGQALGGPNVAAPMLVNCWVAWLGRDLLTQGAWQSRVARIAGMLVVVTALMLTYSRATYVGLFLQLMLLGGVLWHKVRHSPDWRRWQTLGLAMLAVGATLIIAPDATRRLFSILLMSDASASNRLHLYAGSAEFLLLRPLSGWGAGTFPLLYSAFFRIPGISYPYADAHSGLFLTLVERGTAGLAFTVLAVTGFCLRRTFAKTPLWVLLALVGIVPCYVLDNPAFQLNGPALLGLLTLAPLGAVAAQQERRHGIPRWAKPTIIVLLGLWCLGAVQPLPPFKALVEARTGTCLHRLIGQSGLHLRMPGDNCTMNIGHTHEAPSVLAGLAVLADAALNRGGMPVAIPPEVARFGHQTSGLWTTTFAQAAVLLLAQPAPETAQWLHEALPPGELRTSCLRLFGHEAFGMAAFEKHCQQCGALDVPSAGASRQEPLSRYATTATLSQILDAYLALTDPATTRGAALSAAMRGSGDRLGLTRHIVTDIPWDAISFYSGHVREEVVIFRDGLDTWSLVAASRATMDIAPRADTAINRMFGMAGWRVFTAVETLPSLWQE
jgi:hypothetical protein